MGRFDRLLKNVFVAKRELRLYSYALPLNSLVPDGVIMRTWDAPPALSAPWAVVTIENSPTLSAVGRFGTKSTELVRMKLSWMLMPSCVTCVQVGRPPLMAVLVRPRLATPACSWTSDIGFRPFNGSETI